MSHLIIITWIIIIPAQACYNRKKFALDPSLLLPTMNFLPLSMRMFNNSQTQMTQMIVLTKICHLTCHLLLSLSSTIIKIHHTLLYFNVETMLRFKYGRINNLGNFFQCNKLALINNVSNLVCKGCGNLIWIMQWITFENIEWKI